jgi:DNA mismatch repair protein MutL
MLKVLPEQIANLIAAGEVIQRPASVVKELMENAVDAGADSITVIINDSGRTLIQIIDNGCGMSESDATLCFAKHATSKIDSAEDLYKIETYGFRGEALASIAACGDVTLKTKREIDEVATEVHISGGIVDSVAPTSAPTGTNIAVRNIFYNIPARRKFLKSDNAEFRQISAEFIRIALTKNRLSFKLIHNSKEIFVLSPTDNIKQRIVQIEGKHSAKDLIHIQTETSVVSIDGYIGSPLYAKKSQPNQFLFVNGRYFRSPMFNKAIMKAYDKLIPEGTSASYYVFLTLDPSQIDVNIHPSKTEIKFENESVIFEILNACVKEAIGVSAFTPGIDFDMEGAPEIPTITADFYNKEKYLKPPKINYDPLFNPFESDFENEHHLFDKEKNEVNDFSETNEFSETNNSLLVIKGRYIITPVQSGIMLIDAVRAKEKVIYENYINALNIGNPPIQESMFPQTINLTSNSFSIIIEHQELLKSIGFDIRSFGDNCIVVYGIPAVFANEQISPTECIDNLLNNLKDFEATNNNKKLITQFSNEMKELIAKKMVKSKSLYKSDLMSTFEAQLLIDNLFACKEPNIAIDGGYCMTIIKIEDLVQKLKTN